MAEEVSEKPNPSNKELQPQKRFTRRAFLKGLGATVAALAFGQIPEKPTLKHKPPEALPEDILTAEQLEKAHIKIYQTPNVQLFLRPGVFKFPLFRDAASAKLDEVGIVLVDSEEVDWDASENFPEKAKLLFRSRFENPTEKWRLRERKYLEAQRTNLEKTLGWLEDDKKWEIAIAELEPNRNIQNKLQSIEEKQAQLRQELDVLFTQTINLSQEEPPPDYKKTYIMGMFLDGRILAKLDPKLFEAHPEIERTVFIYLAVGGKLKPKPSESYPIPQSLERYVVKSLEGAGYIYGGVSEVSRGFALRHEIGHYDPLARGVKGGYQDEYQADTSAMVSIARAWNELTKTGKTSGYPFAFVTKEGITLTKKLGGPSEEVNI